MMEVLIILVIVGIVIRVKVKMRNPIFYVA